MTLFTDFKNALLAPTSSNADQHRWLNHFAEACSAITGIEAKVTFDAFAADVELDSGLAINPQAAAWCLLDSQRSTVFIRGLYQALLDAAERHPDRIINVLYAGCGPFASLLMPLLSQLPLPRYHFVLLDVHTRSLLSVDELLTHFEFQEAHVVFECTDASRWQSEERFDVIVSEVMQKALEQEPQLAVTQHLRTLLLDDGTFLPERIDIQPVLAHWQVERQHLQGVDPDAMPAQLAESERIALHSPISLSIATAEQWPVPTQSQCMAQFDIPNIADINRFDVILCTTIQVYPGYHLHDWQCTLTLPAKCYELVDFRPGDVLELWYYNGRYPKFTLQKQSRSMGS